MILILKGREEFGLAEKREKKQLIIFQQKDDASENLINKFCKNQSNEEQSQVRKIRV